MRLFQRKKLFVDARVQGAVLRRLVIYWLLGLLVITQILLCWRIAIGPPTPFFDQFHFDVLWTEHAPVVIATVILLPLFLIDTVVLTNRFCGPLYRLRGAIRALAAGDRIEPLRFRDKDFWREVADEFNLLAVQVEQLKRQVALASAAQKITAKGHQDLDPATVP